jgi:hypothetical protein
MLMEATYTLSANPFTALLEALFIAPKQPYFHGFQVGTETADAAPVAESTGGWDENSIKREKREPAIED